MTNIVAPNDQDISIDDDGFVHLTSICNAVGKKLAHYKKNRQSQEFMNELSLEVGIPTSKLMQIVRGRGDRTRQGTWGHPLLAIDIAYWASPKFAVKVTKLVLDWQQGGNAPKAVEHNPLDVVTLSPVQIDQLDKEINRIARNNVHYSGVLADAHYYHAIICKHFGITAYTLLAPEHFMAAIKLLGGYDNASKQPNILCLQYHPFSNHLTQHQKMENHIYNLALTNRYGSFDGGVS